MGNLERSGMTCLTCKHLDLAGVASMARHGFGQCKKEEAYRFRPISSEACGQRQEAAAEVVAKRVAWANSRRGTNK